MKIYVVDDDKSIRSSIQDVLQDEDYLVEVFATGKTMLKALSKERPDLVLLDVWLGNEDGLDILDRIRAEYPALPVLMISGHGTIEQAVQATKKGAVDFLEKPLSLEMVLDRIAQILQIKEGATGRARAVVQLEYDEIIGVSDDIQQVKRSIALAAGTNARVFIYGENGSGKELIARAIYRNSRRADRPFVEVNCAAIPGELIESELFGHEKGAFTGASERRIGRFELADGGTLFLDEICDMSLAVQARMLRALQEQRFTRVGGTENIDVDVRTIAATNIDPEEAIREGRFREDLYYRLNVIFITVPALRERPEDIPLMLEYFLKETVVEHGLATKSFTPQSIEVLQSYPWPGNVRELKNMVERLCILSQGDSEISADNVRSHLLDHRRRPAAAGVTVTANLKAAREEFERNYIVQALKQNEKNISRAARFMGIERTNLHRKIKSLGIDLEKI